MAVNDNASVADVPEQIKDAARHLSAGRLIAFPTETVYGLGANARDQDAVRAIYEAKGRPSENPLIVHCADAAGVAQLVEMSGAARALARAFWPGPLTLVLPLKGGHGLARGVSAGLTTLAVRVPAHPIALSLLRQFGGPIAAPSANLSGRISPTRAEHLDETLRARIAGVLDGGPTRVGLESTIVTLSPRGMILREGGISKEALQGVVDIDFSAPSSNQAVVSAPGQYPSHYAPVAQVRLMADAPSAGEVMLGFGPISGDVNLSSSGDLGEAARALFHCLHQLDQMGKPIAVAPIPNHGIGRAINDRLRRAAAPR